MTWGELRACGIFAGEQKLVRPCIHGIFGNFKCLRLHRKSSNCRNLPKPLDLRLCNVPLECRWFLLGRRLTGADLSLPAITFWGYVCFVESAICSIRALWVFVLGLAKGNHFWIYNKYQRGDPVNALQVTCMSQVPAVSPKWSPEFVLLRLQASPKWTVERPVLWFYGMW